MIVVIGAGPAGLACGAMLQEGGRHVVVLERDVVGAAWTKRYDRLQLHTVRWLSCLPGYRMPRSFGKWPSHERVVVATGYSNVPFLPDWPGGFAGEIVHSADYRNAVPYAGRRVLVVGAGNS